MTNSLLIKSKQKEVSEVRNSSAAIEPARFKNVDADKLRGGYYTPEPIAEWLCDWAIRTKDDTILEPSSGDGVFVGMAARKLMKLGVESKKILEQIKAVELNEVEAKKVSSRLSEILRKPVNGAVRQADFFEVWPKIKQKPVDCVIGNPPFIRYQTFPEESRALAMAIMEHSGLKPNRLTNIWVPFVVAAMECLKPGGRLAMVLPAELLQVNYAAQLRSFLTNRFKRVDLVACNDLFFVGAQQEVVLILADGALAVPDIKNTCAVTLTPMESVSEIVKAKPEMLIATASPKKVSHDSEKWLKYFLSAREISFMRRLRDSESVTCLSTYASVEVGVVTGKNEFFVVNKSIVEQYQLEKHVLPLVGRSSHLAGAIISKKEWKALTESNERVHLFTVDPAVNHLLSPLVKSYIKYGEENKFQTGYKCSIREPWYSVPSLWVPDAFFFRQIYDFPRAVLNTAKGTSTDTIHRMRCHAPAKKVIASLYTHLTAASAEIEGRSYGGGVLELEPNEARRLLMPRDLDGAIPIEECDRLIRAGKLQDVLDSNDKEILIDKVGLTQNECKMLRQIWEKMRDRRISRKKTQK